MAAPTAKGAEGLKFSFVAVRTVSGAVEVHALGESADAALDFYNQLRGSKGRDAKGQPLYTDAVCYLRPRTNRRVKFKV